jgi:hypothetical protein
MGVAVFTGSVALLSMVVFAHNVFNNLPLISGTIIALGITAVKGINYHGVEALYSGHFGSFRGVDLIELAGILIAFLAAALRIRGIRP